MLRIDPTRMFSQWVIWLLVISGSAYVYGNQCDPAAAAACYTDLVHYETLAFPLYGHNEARLDDTCGNINMSFACIEQYYEMCYQAEDCNEECVDLLQDISVFTQNTGLRKLEDKLCDDDSKLREIYLDNAMCLEQNADLYASCHNDSQASQHYISTMARENAIEARCCFFSWYHDCFTNLTKPTCGENATFFVSFAIYGLIGEIADQFCAGIPSNCTRPPLPPDEKPEEEPEDKTDDPSDNEIDDKPIDSSKHTNLASTLKSYTLNSMLLSFLYVLLSKYVL